MTQRSPRAKTPLRELVLFAKRPVGALSPRHSEARASYSEKGERHWIRTAPIDPQTSVALVNDLDVLSVFTGEAMRYVDAGGNCPSHIWLHERDVLARLGRSVGGAQRRQLLSSLDRLANTQVVTTQALFNASSSDTFSLLQYSRETTSAGIEVALPNWIGHELEQCRILQVPVHAAKLQGLKRRMWSLANAHTGRLGVWNAPLPYLRAMSGATCDLRKFRELIARAASTGIPDFSIAMETTAEGHYVTLSTPRVQGTPLPASPGADLPEAVQWECALKMDADEPDIEELFLAPRLED